MDYVGFMYSWAVLWFILIVHSPRTCSANAEGDALSVFKNGLHDPNRILNSWDPTNTDPCTWFQITCNSANAVIRVDLGNTGLSGPLAKELGSLKKLQYLELYGNKFSGKIPKELGNLMNLKSLDLYSNKLTGPIPDELGKLKNLKFLRVQNNLLSGRIPVEALSNCINLQKVQFFPNPHLCNPFFDPDPCKKTK